MDRQYLEQLPLTDFQLHPHLKLSNDGTLYRYRLREQIDLSQSDTMQLVYRPSP